MGCFWGSDAELLPDASLPFHHHHAIKACAKLCKLVNSKAVKTEQDHNSPVQQACSYPCIRTAFFHPALPRNKALHQRTNQAYPQQAVSWNLTENEPGYISTEHQSSWKGQRQCMRALQPEMVYQQMCATLALPESQHEQLGCCCHLPSVREGEKSEGTERRGQVWVETGKIQYCGRFKGLRLVSCLKKRGTGQTERWFDHKE